MKRPQVSTNAGVMTIFAGFLNIFNDVKVSDFFDVFVNLTYGEAIGMIIPIIAGLWGIIHNEVKE